MHLFLCYFLFLEFYNWSFKYTNSNDSKRWMGIKRVQIKTENIYCSVLCTSYLLFAVSFFFANLISSQQNLPHVVT